jgi:preprotein translocase subunit YajC
VNYLLPVIVVLALLAAMTLSRRNRQRTLAQQQHLREEITFGTEVVTMSGLYGTVVGINDDDTVQLSIAPGVEVKWIMAALRDVASLPQNTANRRPGDDHLSGDDQPDGGGPDDPDGPTNS